MPLAIGTALPLAIKFVRDYQVLQTRLDQRAARPADKQARHWPIRFLTAPNERRFGTVSRAEVADFFVRQIDDRALIEDPPLLIN